MHRLMVTTCALLFASCASRPPPLTPDSVGQFDLCLCATAEPPRDNRGQCLAELARSGPDPLDDRAVAQAVPIGLVAGLARRAGRQQGGAEGAKLIAPLPGMAGERSGVQGES